MSMGMVEHLVGYAKADLVVGLGPFADLGHANMAAATWCSELNRCTHTETSTVPDECLVTERTLMGSLPSLRPADADA